MRIEKSDDHLALKAEDNDDVLFLAKHFGIPVQVDRGGCARTNADIRGHVVMTPSYSNAEYQSGKPLVLDKVMILPMPDADLEVKKV